MSVGVDPGTMPAPAGPAWWGEVPAHVADLQRELGLVERCALHEVPELVAKQAVLEAAWIVSPRAGEDALADWHWQAIEHLYAHAVWGPRLEQP